MVVAVAFALVSCGGQGKDNDYSNNRGTESKGSGDSVDSQAPASREVLDKNLERIVGTWELASVKDGGKNVSNTDTVGRFDRIVFTISNKYKAYSRSEQIDSGTFTMNENHSLIYLQTGTGSGTSPWSVSLNEESNVMTMRAARNADTSGKSYAYTYNKTANQ
jgi:hypothetical protein